MAKQPDIKTIVDVWKDKSAMNYNWEQISKSFENTLSLDGATPNAMGDDFDIADSNITNINQWTGAQLLLNGTSILSYRQLLLLKLANIDWTTAGEIAYAPADDEIDNLTIGTDGQMLKSDGSLPYWGEDIDTDEDTIGITIQEDGVELATNVLNLDILYAPNTIITTPASNQVDIDLSLAVNPVLQEGYNAGTTTTGGLPFGLSETIWTNSASVRRIDLGADTVTGTEYAVVMEQQNYFLNNASFAPGVWAFSTRFYASDGTADRSTIGTQISGELGTSNSTAGGAKFGFQRMVNVVGARYVDINWVLNPVLVLFLTQADLCNVQWVLLSRSIASTTGFTTDMGHEYVDGGTGLGYSFGGPIPC
jgi:hypothetical protein